MFKEPSLGKRQRPKEQKLAQCRECKEWVTDNPTAWQRHKRAKRDAGEGHEWGKPGAPRKYSGTTAERHAQATRVYRGQCWCGKDCGVPYLSWPDKYFRIETPENPP